MKRNSKLLLIILVLLSIISACSTSDGSDESEGEINDPKILLRENFEDPASGWDRIHEGNTEIDYIDNGKYRFFVNSPWDDKVATPGRNFINTEAGDNSANIKIEVYATKVSGPDDNDFGVVCRYQDEKNYYFFLISSDGYYAIGKMKDGKRELIEPDQMYPSGEIKQGEATNRLRVECDGKSLALYVNGNQVAETTDDDSFLAGDVGLIVGTFSEPGVEIVFHQFSVVEILHNEEN